MPRPRPTSDIGSVLKLKAAGYTDREVSRLTSVPVNTIRTWRNHRSSRLRKRPTPRIELCTHCGGPAHDLSDLPIKTYAYLLGVYLGDGCLTRNGSSWQLRIYLDASYPGIIDEVCEAVYRVRLDRRPSVWPNPRSNCVTVQSTWRPWFCLFPQHGPGRKHNRTIALAHWQSNIIDAAPGPFLRGLIHTDGWRGTNRVHAKGRDYEYPRYQFSNRSDGIRHLFTDACDRLGVRWRPWTRYHVSVAKRESVAILDSFIGPKH